MNITIDTTEPLSTRDKQILQSLISDGVWPPEAVKEGTVRSASLDAEPGPHGGTIEIEEPAPEDAPSDSDEQTLDLAVQRATALVAEGKSDVVKAALKKVGEGAKRVTELAEENVAAFLKEIS